jgi:hypothetical protein
MLALSLVPAGGFVGILTLYSLVWGQNSDVLSVLPYMLGALGLGVFASVLLLRYGAEKMGVLFFGLCLCMFVVNESLDVPAPVVALAAVGLLAISAVAYHRVISRSSATYRPIAGGAAQWPGGR